MKIEFDPKLKRPFVILGVLILLFLAYSLGKASPRGKADVKDLPLPKQKASLTQPAAKNPTQVLQDLNASSSKISYFSGNSMYIVNADRTKKQKIDTVADQQSAAYLSWDWSPDNNKIVSSAGHIIDIQSKKQTSVPRGRCHNWSPDGNKIIYEAQGGVWIMDKDGSNAHKLVESGVLCTGSNSVGHWFPESTKFIYEDFQSGIYQYDLLTSDEILLYDANAYNTVARSASLSRNGAQIVFMQRRNDQPDGENVMLMNSNGTNLQQLTEFDKEEGIGQPVFTPDGGRIVLLGNVVGDNGGVLVIDVASHALRNVTTMTADVYAPATISPDGKYVAYNAFGTLYIVSLDTGERIKLDDGRFILWSK